MADVIKIVLPIVIVHAIVLAAILFAIKKSLLHDTAQAVRTVKQVEAEVRKKESGIMRQIEEHEKDFAKKRAESEEQLDRQRQESEKEISQLRDRMLAEAKKESQQIVERGKQSEEKLRQEIMQSMEQKAVEYGGQVFKLVFSERMNAEVNKQFIAELLDALEEVDAASITVDAGEAEFRASHPMDPEQKARLKTLLQDKFGAAVEINEQVEPDLMGGLVFKLGSLEIDGSLLNRFQEAIAEVMKST